MSDIWITCFICLTFQCHATSSAAHEAFTRSPLATASWSIYAATLLVSSVSCSSRLFATPFPSKAYHKAPYKLGWVLYSLRRLASRSRVLIHINLFLDCALVLPTFGGDAFGRRLQALVGFKCEFLGYRYLILPINLILHYSRATTPYLRIKLTFLT